MAIGSKTGGRDFQPGSSGNPNGRPPLPPELQAVRKLSPQVLKVLIDKISTMTAKQITELMATGVCNMLEMSIMSIWVKAIEQGDYGRLNFILDRSRIGKVKEQLDVNLKPKVTYKTSITSDGRLLQELLTDEAETIDVGHGKSDTGTSGDDSPAGAAQ